MSEVKVVIRDGRGGNKEVFAVDQATGREQQKVDVHPSQAEDAALRIKEACEKAGHHVSVREA